MRRSLFLLTGCMAAAAILALCAPVAAQNQNRQNATPSPTPVAAGRVPQWRATLPGGTFVVSLRSIVAVAIHEYIVDGAARVTEMNIDTSGNALARFYFLEPITPQSPVALGQSALNKLQDLANQASARSGQEEVWKKVSKTYPGSTHAHTIEFRVESKEDLQKLFESADGAFREMKEGSVTLK